jgi:YihY family inner membrane protein
LNLVKQVLRRIDAFQQRLGPVAVAYGVAKKAGDDNAGLLMTNITYSAFVTVFPLLLLLVTILGLVFSSDPSVRRTILDSALAQFPLIGSELGKNIHALHNSSLIGLFVGIAGLVYGSLGLAGSCMYAMQQVWNVPGTDRPNFLKRTGRSLGFLLVLGLGVGATTFLSGVGFFGLKQAGIVQVGAVVLSLVVNCALFLCAFRILSPVEAPTRALLPGAVLGGIGWTILQSAGNYLVGHTLRNDSEVYGTFAVVLGLLAWIYFAARLTVYAAELNVVLHRRLWPRSVVQPPLTAADEASLAAQAEQNRRRPEQRIDVSFDGNPEPGGTGDGNETPEGEPIRSGA